MANGREGHDSERCHGIQGLVARICTSFIDVPDSIAIAVYFAGCSIRCPGCQNKELWDHSRALVMSAASVCTHVADHPLAQAVVFLGGEPTDQLGFLDALCMLIANKRKVLYTGREFEWLPPSLCDKLDMVVCGPYKQDLHVQGWPASSNQRVFVKDQGTWTIRVT